MPRPRRETAPTPEKSRPEPTSARTRGIPGRPRTVTAYTHDVTASGKPWPGTPSTRLTNERVGLRCACPEEHYAGANYYVSVRDGSRWRPVLGPFAEHDEALARVDAVRAEVLARWNPDGRAHWFGFGTVAMAATYTEPGVLNAALLGDAGGSR